MQVVDANSASIALSHERGLGTSCTVAVIEWRFARRYLSMSKLDKNLAPDKTLAAVCGLYCPACTAYIATREEPQRFPVLAARMRRTVDDLTCEGCRSNKRREEQE